MHWYHLNRPGSSHGGSTLLSRTGSLTRLDSTNIPGGLNRTGTGKYFSWLGDWHHTGTGTRIKKGLVSTAEGFFTGSTGTAKDLKSSIASSKANFWAHLSSRFFRSSDVGLLLLDFLLLGFGDFFLESRGGFCLLISLLSLYPSQHIDLWRVHESGGSSHRGSRNRLLLLFFLPSSVGGGGQLLKLFWGESSANGAALLQNTRVITHPVVPASRALKVAIK